MPWQIPPTSKFSLLSMSYLQLTEKRLHRVETSITALKPTPTPKVLPDFWSIYKKVADEHDAEFQHKYKDDLDTSLIFVSTYRCPPF